MSQAPTKTKTRRLRLGPRSAGVLLTTEEFDRARFVEGWRYELINEVLVVSPIPSLNERDPNEELGRWLRNYQESHPQGSALDATLAEETIETKKNRRRADRVIWAGLGRLPDTNETPTIIIELVSKGKINLERDYVAKRALLSWTQDPEFNPQSAAEIALFYVLRILTQLLRNRHRKRRKLLREPLEKKDSFFGSLRPIMHRNLVWIPFRVPFPQ